MDLDKFMKFQSDRLSCIYGSVYHYIIFFGLSKFTGTACFYFSYNQLHVTLLIRTHWLHVLCSNRYKTLLFVDEVQHRTKQLRMAIAKLKDLRNESTCQNSTLESTQEQITKLCQENDYQSVHMKELEVRGQRVTSQIHVHVQWCSW